ncbi:DnaJ family molecular chaperone [Pseudochrobactrum algeriensis]|uniref:J domain-containing protein n=1 Tax=Pseudochrobactrum algeriensis TaxID=2834768 RepID=UPI001BCBC570|nr:DnaJ family molecular chaperone [Pseudochrobactrum algeriensis]MBX8811652.1 DnaJ family molecular chaperone [Ochrobactrum sp. MR34]QVQ35901.1 DnaJ family molecular chaperone [Pseudochrobactrum algeriensis]QVQ39118.1 DnaJ family molecular chaperone [Pseudochrobactrum algeriensis]QVQ43037.1 DnaJ family molecular chaperone [Pseudochrobactrum algeriensis]
MSIWSSIADFLTQTAYSAFSGVIEAVRTYFEGDAETRRRVAFSIAMIALSAKMAKADGIVSQHEVRAFQDIFEVPEKEADHVSRLYNLAKQDVAGFESYARQIASLCRSSQQNGADEPCGALSDVLDGLFYIAKADGYVHDKEMQFLRRVAEIFGIEEDEFLLIAGRHVNLGPSDPYAVLGLTRGVGFTEAKQHYRKLVRQNHPDLVIARGMPYEFQKIANHRLAAINAAWATLEKQLGQHDYAG